MRFPQTSPLALAWLLLMALPLVADDFSPPLDHKFLASREESKTLPSPGPPLPSSLAIGAMSPAVFSRARSAINRKSRTDAWQLVHRTLPHTDRGRDYCIKAWLDGKVMQKLTLIDSKGADDAALCVFFWQDGRLISIFKYYTGSYTGDPQTKQCTETYNFQDGQLTSWISEPGGPKDPTQKAFQGVGPVLEKQAMELSQPIYRAIGVSTDHPRKGFCHSGL